MSDYNNIPANMRYGGGASSSSIHPIVLIMTLIAVVLMFVLPRKYVVVPFLLTIFLSTFGQQVYIAGVHLFVGRILILSGWVRVRLKQIDFTVMDKLFLGWAICRALATFLEFRETQAAINQCGFLWDSIGGYFLLRFLIRDEEDIARVSKTFVSIVLILATTMANERLQGFNVFGYMGGRLAPFIRDGAIRAQGTFLGPIPAGTFGATIACLFVWLWQSGRARLMGALGVVASMVMVYTSASSTPLMGMVAAVFAISLWPLRKSMRTIRWVFSMALVALHLIMKAPVWMLIARVEFVGGNSGYHRAELIDQCIKHFSDWWLIGVKSTANWGWDLWDQADQFVSEAEAGGLATLTCFVLMISRSFGRLGTARRLVAGTREKEWLIWLLGCALFSHCFSFIGISFNDQTVYAWYALLAMICVVTTPAFGMAISPSHQEASPPVADSQWGDWAVAWSGVESPVPPV